jgi:hypothetical protein
MGPSASLMPLVNGLCLLVWNGFLCSLAGGGRTAKSGERLMLGLLFLSFSALSAMKNISNGVWLLPCDCLIGDTISGSGELSCGSSGVFSPSILACKDDGTFTFGTDLEPKNLGTGKAEAAGEAWKVDCAYARSFAGVPGNIGPPIDTGLIRCPFVSPLWLLLYCRYAPWATLWPCLLGLRACG